MQSLSHQVNAIRARGFDHIANPDIAGAYLINLQAVFPTLLRIDVGIRQYFVLPEALARLRKELEYERGRARRNLNDAQKAIDDIDVAMHRLSEAESSIHNLK